MKRSSLLVIAGLLVLPLMGQVHLHKSNTLAFVPSVETTDSEPSTALPEAEALLTNRLEEVLDSLQSSLKIKGLSAAIRLPNGKIWTGTAGFSTQFDPIRPVHRFAIGSVTKTMVMAVVLQLVEEEKMALDDPISKWLPPFPNVRKEITIRQLLEHRSGLYNFTSHPDFFPSINKDKAAMSQVWTSSSILENFVKKPLARPGKTYAYSNTNYLLLGLLIEALSGNDFNTEIRQRLLRPFQLDETFLPVQEKWQYPLAHVWIDTDGDKVLEDFNYSFKKWKALHSSGAASGGYFSTPRNLAEWMYQLVEGAVLSDRMQIAMRQTQHAPQIGEQYGLGIIERNFGGSPAFGHGGDINYSTAAYYFPEEAISIVVQSNDGTLVSWDLDAALHSLLRAYQHYAPAYSL